MSEAQENSQVEATESVESNSPVVIAVQNPTAEEMVSLRSAISENYNFDVDVQHVDFNFKKSVDKESGIETVRNTVALAMPYPSVNGIVTILQGGGKGLELLIDAVQNIVNAAARELLYADTSLTAATFPVDSVSWEFIANMPKAQRRGGGIPKETWEGFAADYCAVMPEATGKKLGQVTQAAKLLLARLAPVRTNEPVLKLLVDQLTIYATASENIEEFQECVAFLLSKAEGFLNITDEELLENL